MEPISQIVETVNSAIIEKIILIPELRGSVEELEEGLRTKVDLQSVGLDRNSGGTRNAEMTSNGLN